MFPISPLELNPGAVFAPIRPNPRSLLPACPVRKEFHGLRVLWCIPAPFITWKATPCAVLTAFTIV
jgi:hypothetical protein